MSAVFKLIPTTQKYDWGKVGLSSKVAQYAAAYSAAGFTLDENAPYAEVSDDPPSRCCTGQVLTSQVCHH